RAAVLAPIARADERAVVAPLDRLAAAEDVGERGARRGHVVSAARKCVAERAALVDRELRRLDGHRCPARPLTLSARPTRFPTKFRWLCGCTSPPIRPNAVVARPSRSSMPGMLVWNGRFRGARQFGCDGSSTKPAPRLCSRTPVSPQPIPEPK